VREINNQHAAGKEIGAQSVVSRKAMQARFVKNFTSTANSG
jgi:hypothetical protein